MTAVVLPPEVVAECAGRLNEISVEVNRDGATLTRLLLRLLSKPQHGLLLGNLKRYARDNKQFGADEVEKIIVVMEAAMDPEHVKHLARCAARRDKEHAAFLESCKHPPDTGPVTYPRITPPRKEAAKLRRNGNVIAGPWQEGA